MKTLPLVGLTCKAPPTCLHELPAARIGKSKAAFFPNLPQGISVDTDDVVGGDIILKFLCFFFLGGVSEVTWEKKMLLLNWFRVE